jgi:DAK2 domain fusion protein YloV
VFPVPDGDTGTNMSLTMNYAISEMMKNEYTTVEQVSKAIAKGSLMGARGNSGVILSQIFRGFAKGCENMETIDVLGLANAFKEASATAYKAVLKPVEGTILTVIREMGDRAVFLVESPISMDHFFEQLLKQGEKTLKNTPNLLPALKQAGVVDAGGKGLLLMIDGFYDALLGREMEEISHIQTTTGQQPEIAQAHMNTEDILFAYCTEFIVRGKNLENTNLRDVLEPMGDSMVYVPDEDIIKVHIHTNDPGLVMQEALKFGELIKIKIENMKEQHGNLIEQSHEHNFESLEPRPEPVEVVNKPYGFVAIAIGDGLTDVFKDLGVDVVIEGGQTMNPSTEDIHKAIENIYADHIYILPNNSNIILAANQAKALTDKDVYVLSTKTVPQGIAAMLAFDQSLDASENFEEMGEAIGTVKSIQSTYAVRDTMVNDIQIETGDYLSLLDNQIVAAGKDLNESIHAAIALAVDDTSEIITLYYGEEVTKEEAESLKESIEELYEDVEVECYAGKQPIYYYLISVE